MLDQKILIGQPAKHHRQGFIPIREPGTGWLLFLYDPQRQIIEVQRRGQKTLVDLTQFQVGEKVEEGV